MAVVFVCVTLCNLDLAGAKHHPSECSDVDEQSVLWFRSPSVHERAVEVKEGERVSSRFQNKQFKHSTSEPVLGRAVQVEEGEQVSGRFQNNDFEQDVDTTHDERKRRRKRETFGSCQIKMHKVDLGKDFYPRHVFNGTCIKPSPRYQFECVPEEVYEGKVLRRVVEPCFTTGDPRMQNKKAEVWVEDSYNVVVACRSKAVSIIPSYPRYRGFRK